MDRVLQVIYPGIIAAEFLSNTNRVVQAIVLWKECLTFLNKKALEKENDLDRKVSMVLYKGLFRGYAAIYKLSPAIESGKKLLVLLRKDKRKKEEGDTALMLAILHSLRSEYKEAQEYVQKALTINTEIGNKDGEAACYGTLGAVFESVRKYAEAEKYLQKAITINIEIGDKHGEALCYGTLGNVLASVRKYAEAEKYLQKALTINIEIGHKHGEAACYGTLGAVFASVRKYAEAEKYLQKALTINIEIGDKHGVAACYGTLGNVFYSVREYAEAEKYLQKALTINAEIGDRHGEATCYGTLGKVFHFVGEYAKAEKYLQKALTINTEIGDKHREAEYYENLAAVFTSLGEYAKAEDYLQKALTINTEIGDKHGEAVCYGTLGRVFHSVGEKAKAEKYLHKALTIMTEIGNKRGEASCRINLGDLFQSKALTINTEIGDKPGEAVCYGTLGAVLPFLGEYAKAEKYLQKALTINTETGNKPGEATCYGNLGNVFHSVREYAKAEKYLQKALTIHTEIGDKPGEAVCYGNLGRVFHSVGEKAKAEKYLHKALTIMTEIGNKRGEASCRINLGGLFRSVGEYAKAEKYLQKALTITTEIGDKHGEAACYDSLGAMFTSVGEHVKAEECLQKALTIATETGEKHREATCYINLGTMFASVGECAKAEECLQKALTSSTEIEIGGRHEEGTCYGNLGAVFASVGEYAKAEEYFRKAIQISKDTGHIECQFVTHVNLSYCCLALTGNASEALSNLLASIEKCERMLNFLGNNDRYKILFFDKHASPYRLFSSLCCASGKYYEALHVAELGRARALADLVSDRYFVEKEVSFKPESFAGILKVIRDSNRTCLFISYHGEDIFLWIAKQSKPIAFRQTKLCKSYVSKHGEISVDDLFKRESLLRNFHVLPQEQCEDRSLFSLYANQVTNEANLEDSLSSLRLLNEEEVNTDPEPPTLCQLYNMLIAPVSDLLEGSEIIVVPDRCFFQVPFAALHDECNRYLSDSFRIRIVPSLLTLKLILDSPAGSHSETGALIVGEPKVSYVCFKGELRRLGPLPGAKKEAEMIARLLPESHLLIGKQATKKAVLQRLSSVSLVHFAAHGDAERGEIALTPPDSAMRPPHESDCLLTMTDISQVRLSAKLVVLSCCHTARGQIRTEGVVGIARAFLGSGARSVIVALWALQDDATEQFMRRFYEDLVQGESTSECLHRAMKWMRNNGFSEVRQWAPFMLIGDDVSFHFGEEK
ncbi:uncharacterized protein [Porites lutea]|uniref:uncharacterized protein n=1 Tax=Porites lutea TaxID=51062 RepID=UPI003CC5546C